MDVTRATTALMRLYPRIFFACHTRHVRDTTSGRVLSAHQASVLDHLDVVEPTFVKDLAAHMGVTPSTISIALDRLGDGGYVERVQDKQDRRRVGVVLTTSGAAVRDDKSVLDEVLVRALLGLLHEAQREAAIAGLTLLASAAAELGRQRALLAANGPEEHT